MDRDGRPMEDPMTTQQRDKLLEDPATSYWLYAAWQQLRARDPVDALADVETLLEMLKAREVRG